MGRRRAGTGTQVALGGDVYRHVRRPWADPPSNAAREGSARRRRARHPGEDVDAACGHRWLRVVDRATWPSMSAAPRRPTSPSARLAGDRRGRLGSVAGSALGEQRCNTSQAGDGNHDDRRARAGGQDPLIRQGRAGASVRGVDRDDRHRRRLDLRRVGRDRRRPLARYQPRPRHRRPAAVQPGQVRPEAAHP
jgi:hypothetical protein